MNLSEKRCLAILEQEENLLRLYNEDEIQALNAIS